MKEPTRNLFNDILKVLNQYDHIDIQGLITVLEAVCHYIQLSQVYIRSAQTREQNAFTLI